MADIPINTVTVDGTLDSTDYVLIEDQGNPGKFRKVLASKFYIALTQDKFWIGDGTGKPSEITATQMRAVLKAVGTKELDETGLADGYFIKYSTASGKFVVYSGTNLITNTNLAQASANTIKGNATASTANVSDIALTTYQVLGREGSNITGIATRSTIVGSATLVAGTATVTDSLISATSLAIVTASNTGVLTSVPIRYTAASTTMTFTTGQAGDTATFTYMIFV